jgi:hypothetical protein
MMAKKSNKIRPQEDGSAVYVRLAMAHLTALDEWRLQQPDLPSRAEAIRRLMELGLSASGKRGLEVG